MLAMLEHSSQVSCWVLSAGRNVALARKCDVELDQYWARLVALPPVTDLPGYIGCFAESKALQSRKTPQ